MTLKALQFFLVASVLALCAPAWGVPRDLLATASDQAVVLARVQPPEKGESDALTDQTLILARRLGKDTRWRKLATLGRRVVSVAACDQDAKVLLDTGDWMTIWGDGNAFGPPAPNVRLISLAADHETLWAVGVPAPATTQPASTKESAAAVASYPWQPGPATQPAAWPRSPAVYRFDGVHWFRVIALPAEVDGTEPAALSLAIIDHQPVLATSSGGGGIRVWTAEEGHWTGPRELAADRPIVNFDILTAGLPPTLWLTDGGPGSLADLAGQRPLTNDGAAVTDPRSATRAAEAIRLYSASGSHLFEQAYGSDGRPMGKRAELVIDLVGPDSEVQSWLAPTLTVIVTMLLFGAARRTGLGELPAGLAEANFALAPLLPRFAAGAIDALPVLLSILYVARQMTLAGVTDDMPTNQQMVPFYIGSGIYLLYTIVCELLLGKTLGKWIFALRIANLDGTRPSRGALLLRNILRLVDLVLMWLPLAMILFSPLRQRVGDIAAGTVVVRAAEQPKSEA